MKHIHYLLLVNEWKSEIFVQLLLCWVYEKDKYLVCLKIKSANNSRIKSNNNNYDNNHIEKCLCQENK